MCHNSSVNIDIYMTSEWPRWREKSSTTGRHTPAVQMETGENISRTFPNR